MRITDYISKAELAEFRKRSTPIGLAQLGINYLIIAAAFAAFIVWPSPWTAVMGAMILGGRILGLGILLHDAAHGALFERRWLNVWAGRWLMAGPILGSFEGYRKGHMMHHRYAGTKDDPDLPFVIGYPTSKASMRRKFTRDLSGKTGLRDLAYQLSISSVSKRLPFIVSHTVMFAVLWSLGAPEAYALWWAGQVFVLPAIMRIRVMGEHGGVPDLFDADPRNNTRTTLANPLERLLIAPNFVNFHCEHHVAPEVPGHNLPKLHRLLVARGFYAAHPHAKASGYWSVIARCIGAGGRPGTFGKGEASFANMS